MQDSSAFQYIAIDLIDLSLTNPRRTIDEAKLQELAQSIVEHGVIQPVTLRPKDEGRFELVAGERRYRASMIAEQFAVPANVRELTDAQAMEWQLIENSQRVDVHPYEEAQGYQRLLNMPGYDVAAIATKAGKSTSHIYARLSLLQLIPNAAEAFTKELITASHANLLARLPQEFQAKAYEQCWRKDWNDKEPHLLPAKFLSNWIATNLYLALADAPFDREDATLHPVAGSCAACPRRSGFNTSLFIDVQGDQCLDGACYRAKVNLHIEREMDRHPQLVQIETSWRNVKEQRPEALKQGEYNILDQPENPEAEPSCPSVKSAIVVFGKHVGKTLSVCTDINCIMHDSATAEKAATLKTSSSDATPEATAKQESTTGEESTHASEQSESVEQWQDEEQGRRDEERRTRFAAEQEQIKKLAAERESMLQRVLDNAPTVLTAQHLRFVLAAFLHLDRYEYAEELVTEIIGEEAAELSDRTCEDILINVMAEVADEKMTRFVLQFVLIGHRDPVPEGQQDFLAEAYAMFKLVKPAKLPKPKKDKKPTLVQAKPAAKKTAKKKIAA